MNYVDYIYTPSDGTYGIDLGYIPSTQTRVKIRAKLVTDGTLLFGIVDDSSSWFRFFAYDYNRACFDIPHDSDARIEIDTDYSVDYVDYEFGFSGDTMYLKDSFGNYADAYAGSYTFNFTSGFKLWGNLNIYEGSRVYDIEVYEGETLARHYRPAYDSNLGAGLYDGTTFYGKTQGSDTIGYELTQIKVDFPAGRSNYVPASGGSFSGTVEVAVDFQTLGYYFDFALNSSKQSAATLTINGNDVSDTFSADTIGTYQFEISFPNWDGSGDVNAKGRRYSNYIIQTHRASDGAVIPLGNTPFTASVYQNTPLVQSQPLYLGTDEIDTLYLGDNPIEAIYLGEDLVFGIDGR